MKRLAGVQIAEDNNDLFDTPNNLQQPTPDETLTAFQALVRKTVSKVWAGLRSLAFGVSCAQLIRSNSSHTKRRKRRIHRIAVEAGLELGKQLAGDGRDVRHAGHRQQDTFRTGIESHLHAFS